MKNKIIKFLILGILLSGCSSESSDPLNGKVKVPETILKTKDQVEKEFEIAGLTPEFVEGEMEETANIFQKTIKKGVCDNYSTFNTEFIDNDVAGRDDKIGTYAEKGSKIVVPCAEKDFVYKDDNNENKEESQEETNNKSQEEVQESTSSINDDMNTMNSFSLNTGDTTSYGAQKILPDMYTKIESMQTKMQGYIDNPKTYTLKANLDIVNDYSELLNMYNKLAKETISYDEYLNLIDAQNKMILTQLDLPEIYND